MLIFHPVNTSLLSGNYKNLFAYLVVVFVDFMADDDISSLRFQFVEFIIQVKGRALFKKKSSFISAGKVECQYLFPASASVLWSV